MNQTSSWKIIAKNTFTLFNFVNLVLAAMVAFVGSYKNMLFIFIAIANTLISIINELRAKKIIDKMRLTSEQKPTVIRNNKSLQIPPEEVKKGDLTVLSLGDQVLYDSVIQSGVIEVNEAFITGEQDNIEKRPGDRLISGSFVVSGAAKAVVEHVGPENSLNKLESEARTIKTADSKLFKLMNNIVKYISWTLIPIGALLLWARFRTESDPTLAVTSTVAALINMIPEGLILLTSSVLALATIRLSKKQVLVQDLYSVETLARVDTICLDKTGTLTTGRMTVHDYTAYEKSFETTLKSILSHQMSENATTSALRQKFLKTAKFKATGQIAEITDVVPFSSDRKYSGIVTENATYLLGAIEFLTSDQELIAKVHSASAGYRTLAVVKHREGVADNVFFGDVSRFSNPETYIPDATEKAAQRADFPGSPAYDVEGEKVRPRKDMSDRTPSLTLLGVIRLEDELRPDAKDIINYFYDNDITAKIISGDDLAAVTEIAAKVGLKDLRAVDLSGVEKPNYDKLTKNYAIFTRVKPAQKKQLIKSLKKQGRTVAMTGDGVNDILAMKEADVSLAIGEGSDAARRASKLVLLNSDFAAVPEIISEGRQSINNLERSTSLFLAKTVYASILAVIFVFLPFSYPFKPIEMSLLNFACIGLPGLILALEKNTDRVKDRFLTNILTYSVPIGLTVSLCMIALAIVAGLGDFPRYELSTAAISITFIIDLILIYWISRPLNKLRAALLLSIIAFMAIIFLLPFARDFFEFAFLSKTSLIASLSILAAGLIIFELLRRFLSRYLPEKLFHLDKNSKV